MKRLSKFLLCSVLLIQIVAPGAANLASGDDVYRLTLFITTTSDWTRVAISGCTIAPFVNQIVEGVSAPQLQVTAGADLLIAKQQFNETRVVASFEVYLANLEAAQLTFEITKGHLGYTTVEILNHNQEPAQLITQFTHEGIANNSENKRVFLIESSKATARGAVSLPPKPLLDKKLLAFYYPWYGTATGQSGYWRHWDPNSPRYASAHKPLAGYYDSRDAATITRHINEAREAGVDAFISSWWGIGSFEDQAFKIILPIAERENFPVTIYYEVAEARDQIASDLSYIIKNYGRSPAFLEVDGSPVIFIYVRVTEKFGKADWEFVFQQLAQQNIKCFCIGDNFYDYLFEQFQGVHTYIAVQPLDEVQRLYQTNALKARITGKLFAATVVPGIDHSAISANPLIVDRENGEYYGKSWAAALASSPDWVLITSFNEWHEGTEIEPSVEFGRQYLELTRREAESWKGR